MEEKVLLKSEQYDVRKLFKILLMIGAALSVLALGIRIGGMRDYRTDVMHTGDGSGAAWAMADCLGGNVLGCFCPLLAAALLGGLACLWLGSTELTITDRRVFGRAAWGKRVDVPVDSVTAAVGLFKGVSVCTSSGRISFLGIRNGAEVCQVISGMLVERQQSGTGNEAADNHRSEPSGELMKLRALLDAGVITQEDLDAMKEQLNGL